MTTTDLTTPEMLQKAAASRALAKDPAALLDDAGLDVFGRDREAILARLAEMPESMRRSYLKAMSGTSPQAAIRAFCFMCMGWNRAEVPLCSDPACPLYPYRAQ